MNSPPSGLSGLQLRPTGGAAAGSQRAGGREGAGGGDGAPQREPGQSFSSQAQKDRPHHRGGCFISSVLQEGEHGAEAGFITG